MTPDLSSILQQAPSLAAYRSVALSGALCIVHERIQQRITSFIMLFTTIRIILFHVKFEDGPPISILRNEATLHKKNWGSKSMRFLKPKFSRVHHYPFVLLAQKVPPCRHNHITEVQSISYQACTIPAMKAMTRYNCYKGTYKPIQLWIYA